MDGYTDMCKSLHRRYSALKQDRQQFQQRWLDIQKYVLPDHGRGINGNVMEQEDKDGSDKMTPIYDSTATAANSVLSAGLLSGLTNPSRPWIRLGAQDPALEKSADVKSWLYTASERMRFIHSRTDLYTALHHSYEELGGFGTGPIAVLEDFHKVMRFRPFTCGEYYLAANASGDVDTLYREAWMTSIQMVEKFGKENCSFAVQRCYEQGNTEKAFKIIQAIEPNDGRIEYPGSARWKWRSVYKQEETEEGKVLSFGGYRRFPILAPRWFVVGNQVYGSKCPGMVSLPDVKQLQKETEKKLVALDKMVDPPTVSSGVPTELQINTFPGGHTFDNMSPGGDGMRQLYQVNMPLNHLQADIAGLAERIEKRYFNNLFLLLAQDPGRMTAREVAERHDEKLQLLGPSINRFKTELLQGVVEQSLDIMWEAGLLPPAPPELQGQPLRVEFDSVLSQAQKMAGIGADEQFIAMIGSVSAVFPDVRDKVDPDQFVDDYADRTGINPAIVVSDEEVLKVRDRRAKQAQMQQALQTGQVLAESAKTLSQTDTGGNTALSTMLGALPGGAGGAGVKPGA